MSFKSLIYISLKIEMETYLLIKYLKCSTTPEEEAAVRHWLADDPDGSHARQYSDAHFLYEGMLIHGGDHSKGFASVQRPKKTVRRRILAVAASVAAAIAIIAGTGLLTRNYIIDGLSARTETIYVPAGKSMQLTLEDGTQLWLNSGSEIEYPVVFSRKSRNVTVHSGEVMFDVAKDTGRPFNVNTYASTISVYGTKFDVAVDESAREFSAALLRGSIKVSSHLRTGEEYMLQPNQMVRLEDDHLYVERIADPRSVGCWTEGLIDVTDIPFDRLMKKFELAYDVRIVIARDTLPQIRYTRGKVRISEGVKHALSMLALASDFSYDYDRLTNTVVIR